MRLSGTDGLKLRFFNLMYCDLYSKKICIEVKCNGATHHAMPTKPTGLRGTAEIRPEAVATTKCSTITQKIIVLLCWVFRYVITPMVCKSYTVLGGSMENIFRQNRKIFPIAHQWFKLVPAEVRLAHQYGIDPWPKVDFRKTAFSAKIRVSIISRCSIHVLYIQ